VTTVMTMRETNNIHSRVYPKPLDGILPRGSNFILFATCPRYLNNLPDNQFLTAAISLDQHALLLGPQESWNRDADRQSNI
jgi:hypothetical protein